jgi:pimeloyl-ACP methyl ester carboxylesterase
MAIDMTTDGIQVACRGDGPSVLMIHGSVQGGPASGEDYWRSQLPLADRGWGLVLPSRPGHGPSPSRGPEDLEVEAVWVAELLGDGAHLVGHSYGAAIAMCAAGLRPEIVHSLTLIEPPLYGIAGHRPEAIAFKQALVDALDTKIPMLAMVRFMKAAGIPPALQKPRPKLKHLRAMGKGARTMRDPSTWDETAAVSRAREGSIAAMTVNGGWSPGFDAITDELAGALGGHKITIESGHHFPHKGDTADQFNEALDSFMSARA